MLERFKYSAHFVRYSEHARVFVWECVLTRDNAEFVQRVTLGAGHHTPARMGGAQSIEVTRANAAQFFPYGKQNAPAYVNPRALPEHEFLAMIQSSARCAYATFAEYASEFGSESAHSHAAYEADCDLRARLYAFFGPVEFHKFMNVDFEA